MYKPALFSAFSFNRFSLWWGRRERGLAPLLCAALVLTGCVNVENVAPSVSRIPSGGNPQMLAHGRQIYVSQCTSCHSAQVVSKYSAAEWPRIVSEMAPKSKLSAEDERAVLNYVLAARRAPLL